jgi:hypothetical protein
MRRFEELVPTSRKCLRTKGQKFDTIRITYQDGSRRDDAHMSHDLGTCKVTRFLIGAHMFFCTRTINNAAWKNMRDFGQDSPWYPFG